MDRAGEGLIPSADRFSRVLRQRRQSAQGFSRLLQQLIGLEAKLAQYEQGEQFIEAVESNDRRLLDLAWERPENLPTIAEIRDPSAWLSRVAPARVRLNRALVSGDRTTELLARCTFPPKGTVVSCAVSGGADSLAMLVLAVAHGCAVTAVHVDHGLRAGSEVESELVAEAAERFGAAFRAERVHVEAGPNLEARAREARRAVLAADALLGHTADDQAETILLNLMRGAGLEGLGGMRPGRRPILALRRTETHQLCTDLGIDVVDDPMNRDPAFRRVRVRRELLPLLDDIARARRRTRIDPTSRAGARRGRRARRAQRGPRPDGRARLARGVACGCAPRPAGLAAWMFRSASSPGRGHGRPCARGGRGIGEGHRGRNWMACRAASAAPRPCASVRRARLGFAPHACRRSGYRRLGSG